MVRRWSETSQKRAFLVLGPESTGTRLAARILIQAGGCHGDFGHKQRFDEEEFGNLNPVVWRRSVPHDRAWLCGDEILKKCDGRNVLAVVTMRNWYCTKRSQLSNQYAHTDEEAALHIRHAFAQITSFLEANRIWWRLLVYESLLARPRTAQRELLLDLGLPEPGLDNCYVKIQPGNDKHWSKLGVA